MRSCWHLITNSKHCFADLVAFNPLVHRDIRWSYRWVKKSYQAPRRSRRDTKSTCSTKPGACKASGFICCYFTTTACLLLLLDVSVRELYAP